MHYDRNNIGESRIALMGNFAGGALELEDGRLFDEKRRWCQYNGSTTKHGVQPFEGERLSCVLYTSGDPDSSAMGFLERTGNMPAKSRLGRVREEIIATATERLGHYGEGLIPVTSHEAGAIGTWHVLMCPAEDELIGAKKVTRVKDRRGDNFVACFPRRLKGFLKGSIPGRAKGVQSGARPVWYRVADHGRRRAEQLAKRHLDRYGTRLALWRKITGSDDPDLTFPADNQEAGTEITAYQKEPKRKIRGKQSPYNVEGRPVGKSIAEKVIGDEEVPANRIAVIDIFGGFRHCRAQLYLQDSTL